MVFCASHYVFAKKQNKKTTNPWKQNKILDISNEWIPFNLLLKLGEEVNFEHCK